MEILFVPSFIRKLNKFPEEFQEEIIEKIELFRNIQNHKKLRVHKLKGALDGKYSFSVNYEYRIVFVKKKKDTAIFLTIGDHAIYR